MEVTEKLNLFEGKKRRKFWLPAFSPFPSVFSKVFFFQGCYKLELFGKGLIHKISGLSKFSAFTDDKSKFDQMLELGFKG